MSVYPWPIRPLDRLEQMRLIVVRAAITEARGALLLPDRPERLRGLERAKEFGELACWHLERVILAIDDGVST